MTKLAASEARNSTAWAISSGRPTRPAGIRPARTSFAGLTDIVAARARGFLARYPKVRLQLVVTDRPVDLIEERIDVALRVRRDPTSDASLTMRTLGSSRRILVAAPQVARSLTPDIAALGAVPG